MQHGLVPIGSRYGGNDSSGYVSSWRPNARLWKSVVLLASDSSLTELDMRHVTPTLQMRCQPAYFVIFIGRVLSVSVTSLMPWVLAAATTRASSRPFPSIIRLCFTACFLFPAAVIYPYSHPLMAMTSQCHPDARRQATSSARSVRKRLRPAILERGRVQSSMSISRGHSVRSTVA